jgi:hypothetical protein
MIKIDIKDENISGKCASKLYGAGQRVLNDYGGSGFLAVSRFGPFPSSFPLSKASCLSLSVFLCVAGRAYLTGGGCGGGAKSYDGEKAWTSIND